MFVTIIRGVVVPESDLSRAAWAPFVQFWVLDTAATMAEGPRPKIAERVRCGDQEREGITTPLSSLIGISIRAAC